MGTQAKARSPSFSISIGFGSGGACGASRARREGSVLPSATSPAVTAVTAGPGLGPDHSQLPSLASRAFPFRISDLALLVQLSLLKVSLFFLPC